MHQQGFFDRKGIDKNVRVLVFAKLGVYRYCLAFVGITNHNSAASENDNGDTEIP